MTASIFKRKTPVLLAIVLLVLSANRVSAQTTEFTYQGKLSDGGNPATGTYDFEFLLYDALAGGTAQGLPVQRLNVAVTSGIFTVQLDFDNQFNGANRFLDISVKASGGGLFTPLTPRQQVNVESLCDKELEFLDHQGAPNTILGEVLTLHDRLFLVERMRTTPANFLRRQDRSGCLVARPSLEPKHRSHRRQPTATRGRSE